MNFSIIIPLYNKENAIKDTIESVLKQTYPNFEIVVVDDGSTDRSASIVALFSDVRIRYLKKNNGGVSSARNYGIKHSKFDWIMFLDADDLLDCDALEIICRMMSEAPGYLFYGGNMQLYGGMCCKDVPGFVHISNNPYKDWWKMRLAPEMGTFVMHRSLLETIGFFDTRMSFFEDLDFTSRLMDKIPFIYTSSLIKTYRKEFSTLSVSLQPIEKEFAYYLTKERVRGDFWKQLVLAYNVWDTKRHRKEFNDVAGTRYYSKQLRLFCLPVRIYIQLMDLKRQIGSFIRAHKIHF